MMRMLPSYKREDRPNRRVWWRCYNVTVLKEALGADTTKKEVNQLG